MKYSIFFTAYLIPPAIRNRTGIWIRCTQFPDWILGGSKDKSAPPSVRENIDKDGDMDVVVSWWKGIGPKPISVFLNNGSNL